MKNIPIFHLAAIGLFIFSSPAIADQVILDDLIVDGSRVTELRPQAVQALDQISTMNVLPPNVEMFFWMLLEEVDRALTIARRLEQEAGLYEPELLFTDEFRAMRRQPDFAEFITAIGLTEYWASAGCSWSDDRVRCQ